MVVVCGGLVGLYCYLGWLGGCTAVVVGCLQVALGFVSGFDLVLAVF